MTESLKERGMVEYASRVALSDGAAVQITTTEISPRNICELVAGYLRAVERFRAPRTVLTTTLALSHSPRPRCSKP